MRTVWLLVLLTYGCSQVPRKEAAEDEVSLNAALKQAHASYLLGCVEALKPLSITPVFPMCKEKADAHIRDIEDILGQNPIVPPVN